MLPVPSSNVTSSASPNSSTPDVNARSLIASTARSFLELDLGCSRRAKRHGRKNARRTPCARGGRAAIGGQGLLDVDDALGRHARLQVAQRCIYGSGIDAVERDTGAIARVE